MVSPSIRQQRGPARGCMVRRSGLGLASLSAERQEQAPTRLKRTEAGRAALKTAVSRLQEMLAAEGISKEEIPEDFKQWRAGGRK